MHSTCDPRGGSQVREGGAPASSGAISAVSLDGPHVTSCAQMVHDAVHPQPVALPYRQVRAVVQPKDEAGRLADQRHDDMQHAPQVELPALKRARALRVGQADRRRDRGAGDAQVH